MAGELSAMNRSAADLSSLNPQQRQVVCTVDTGCCVISIPGSGKTKTVTEKIVHLLTGHEFGLWVRPRSVMAVTFTSESGKELTERTRIRVGKNCDRSPITGTFHSLFMQSLKRVGAAMTDRRLASPGQSAQYVERALVKATNGAWDRYKLEEKDWLRQRFDSARCRLTDPYNLKGKGNDSAAIQEADQLKAAFKHYQEMMRDAHLMDFGMILEETLLFLKSKGRAVERTDRYRESCAQHERENGYPIGWADEFPSFLGGVSALIVDEAQDIDELQLEIICAIAGEQVTVDIVGDDDQSIYRFRNGLGYGGMMEFTRRTGAELILMENNYRCRQEILEIAGEVISHNTARNEKSLYAHRGRGAQMTLDKFNDGETEIFSVCSSMGKIIKEGRGKTPSMAVIARVNKILDSVEAQLSKAKIPNARLGGSSIWGDEPVCFMTAYLSSLLRNGDKASFEQCLYWAGVRSAIGKVSGRDGELVTELNRITNESRRQAWSDNPADVERIVSKTYKWFCKAVVTSNWSDKKKDFNIGRLRIAVETIAGHAAVTSGEHGIGNLPSARERKWAPGNGYDGNLESRLRDLQQIARTGKDDPKAVKIVSMHGSKGLEFDCCWIVGLDDGTIPSTKNPDLMIDPAERAECISILEEERRLLYVAMTRAKDNLHMSWAVKPVHKPKAKEEFKECRFISALPSVLRPPPTRKSQDIDTKAGYTT